MDIYAEADHGSSDSRQRASNRRPVNKLLSLVVSKELRTFYFPGVPIWFFSGYEQLKMLFEFNAVDFRVWVFIYQISLNTLERKIAWCRGHVARQTRVENDSHEFKVCEGSYGKAGMGEV